MLVFLWAKSLCTMQLPKDMFLSLKRLLKYKLLLGNTHIVNVIIHLCWHQSIMMKYACWCIQDLAWIQRNNKSLELVCVCVDRNSHLLGVYCCLLQLSAHHCIIIYTVYFSFCFRFQFFIELSHIRKCFTQKGNVFVLEEFGKMICLFLFSIICSIFVTALNGCLMLLLFPGHLWSSAAFGAYAGVCMYVMLAYNPVKITE